MQRLHYTRTRTDNCTGARTTESRVDGPYRLWAAVPDERVSDVNHSEGAGNGLSGSPLRSSSLPEGSGGANSGPAMGGPSNQLASTPVAPGNFPIPFLPGILSLIGAFVGLYAVNTKKKSLLESAATGATAPPQPQAAAGDRSTGSGQPPAPGVLPASVTVTQPGQDKWVREVARTANPNADVRWDEATQKCYINGVEVPGFHIEGEKGYAPETVVTLLAQGFVPVRKYATDQGAQKVEWDDTNKLVLVNGKAVDGVTVVNGVSYAKPESITAVLSETAESASSATSTRQAQTAPPEPNVPAGYQWVRDLYDNQSIQWVSGTGDKLWALTLSEPSLLTLSEPA